VPDDADAPSPAQAQAPTDSPSDAPPRDWEGYYAWNSGREPRPLLTRALEHYGEVAPQAVAVDVGCGDGIETRALLAAGFAVTAIDATEGAIDLLGRLPEAGSRLTPVLAAMQDADIPSCDLVYAGYALPFCPPDAFDEFWSRLRAALRPGGLLACDLFGDRDQWLGTPDMTFVTRDRVQDLVAGLDVRSVHEIEEEGMSFSGPKHWHTFQVVARQPVVA
jgi:SAM-dependent methyltransferase